MEWSDDAIVLSSRAHGETGAILELLTRDHGRHAGLVRGGASRRVKPTLQPGNGVHVHFSLKGIDYSPATYDPHGMLGLTEVARHFTAGLLHHMPALCAITAPAAVSYLRLRPNRWAPTHADLRQQDRAAAVRVCPVIPGPDAARQFNVEFRVADAAASPYLVLGALAWAGMDGIKRALEIPDEAPPLPASLSAALDALQASTAAPRWFGPIFLNAYLMHKRGELAGLEGLDEKAQCERYAQTY